MRAKKKIQEMSRYRPYPEYKDTGMEWLGEIPKHWELKKLKAVSSLQTGITLGKNYESVALVARPYLRVANVQAGYLRLDDIADIELPASEVNRYELIPNDVVVTEGGDFDKLGRGYVWEGQIPGCLHQNHIFAVRTKREALNPHFLAAVMASGYGRAYFTATSKQSTNLASTNSTKLRNFSVPLPARREQEEILSFISEGTENVDALIEKKERLIELLQEKRTAVITQAVTKGLDPDVPMKDSGVEWLGEIPAHWRIFRLRRVVRKFVDYRGKTPQKTAAGVRLVTARNIKNQSIDFSLSEEFIPEDLYHEWMVRGLPERGDVLVTTEAPLGESAQILDSSIALAQRIILMKARRDMVTNDYLKYHFSCDSGRMELWSRATGSTALGIKASHFKATLLTVPPIAEQIAIATFIDNEAVKIDALTERVNQAIDYLREYRTALISAAVTGKIDVRQQPRA